MSERPAWWPKWEPNKYPPFAFHVEVWDAAVEAGVKAALERVQAKGLRQLLGWRDRKTSWFTIRSDDWQQLRKEAGLDE